MLFVWTFFLNNTEKNCFPLKYEAERLFSTLKTIIRSCDTEDWSNDAENTAAHHRNILGFKLYSHRKQKL